MKYKAPEMEIVKFLSADVLAASEIDPTNPKIDWETEQVEID